MKIIGICGRSGSGKSTVSALLNKKGVPVLDCDVIYHDLVSSPSDCLLAIGDHFGSHVIRSGALDRNALREIVFSDEKKLSELNRLTHPFILDELKKRLEKLSAQGSNLCVIDAPLFFEAGLETWCDVVCAVVSNEDLEIQRICQRDHIAPTLAKERIDKQISNQFLKSRADFVIENNGDLNELENACNDLIKAAFK